MDIRKACLEAKKVNGMIYRKNNNYISGLCHPTNNTKELVGIYDFQERKRQNRWEPSLDDLIATDWQVWAKK